RPVRPAAAFRDILSVWRSHPSGRLHRSAPGGLAGAGRRVVHARCPMRDERLLRRPEFCAGTPVRLTDGQLWSFPTPEGRVDAGGAFDGDLAAVVSAVAEAAD